MILSIDALFGLPRKHSAGSSSREALHGSLYFLDQSSVDEFVNSTTVEKDVVPQVQIMPLISISISYT